ncbi:phage tail terminator-like protein [Chromobacterium violaceum]|uniref:phage tail terminator-like protein n=1 Tax=Chromobacterium violaceum TaxID=536 RepID=UPI001C8B7A85|nr:phage tail terminator-like protein [Chromobacterium violaceum]MBX9267203.1 DUF4128 domain-containing protein [Chromobacterium violaceum]
MVSLTTIRAAFERRLADWAKGQGLPVAWENIEFTPPADGLYLRAFLLPAEGETVNLEYGACEIGLYQINVCAPQGKGPRQAEKLAEALQALYPAGDVLGGVRLVRQPAIGPPIPDGVSRIVPVTIRYSTI